MTRSDGARFYVWREGSEVRANWRHIPPEKHEHRDCTDMTDDEFNSFMQSMESENQEPTT